MTQQLDEITSAIDALVTSVTAEIQRVTDNLTAALAKAQSAPTFTVSDTAATDLHAEIQHEVDRLNELRVQVEAVEPSDVAKGNATTLDTSNLDADPAHANDATNTAPASDTAPSQ